MPFVGLDDEPSALRDEVVRLQAENARLLHLLELTPRQARPPAGRTGVFDGAPGPAHAGSPAAARVACFASLFAARPDGYAQRWENARSGPAVWVPAVRGGWRKGIPATEREYLLLTEEVITAHLSGELEPSLTCCWTAIAANGWLPTSMAPPPFSMPWPTSRQPARLAHPRRWRCPAQAWGGHVWRFFTGPVPAPPPGDWAVGLLREVIAVRGRMDRASYGRLFPSPDVVGVGGFGNLIAAHSCPRVDTAPAVEAHRDDACSVGAPSGATPGSLG